MMHHFLEYSDEVRAALSANKPVLALESTVITHGLPFPDNLSTGFALEEIARRHRVVPATIAIMDGKIKIGLNTDELERLAESKDVLKASKRDLAFVLSEKRPAGTTVAATLFCAAAAGIKVFATGGIGGVHRGLDMDVSADLIELSQTPIAVVCAGAKAILDLPKTLEFLETYSVPVIGYQTDTLPAFYTDKTAYKLTMRADNVKTLKTIVEIQNQLNLASGILIMNPIPQADSIPMEMIEPVIEAAVKKAEALKISGKDITPFLLSEVTKATAGVSQQANISLIKNNVRLGAELAFALAMDV
ncbi:pseudouridine-5'-phosphate glycosidase [Legionella lytica]|uniref:Pseudouridine-5'-phosphate glycosidase n=2 Tax=Legionella lytica TaxID=96232 RepID=A0ABY4YDG2_9GAMM|nr:pseudouridine-5'-phosphate glycosidase [Legionella lytica]USQ15134.1 pseudouridine-5'-phosphate glycosidase [Legionella lytica]